jgi:YebC/PmpR family DNA-binding regulatory protein
MSGHSKWSNIKNRKAAVDKKKSSAFTKCAKEIMVAVRQNGGETNIESNVALRTAVEKARQMNMPKDNITRLLERFEERKDSLISLTMEGFASGGVPVLLEVETDNKNRTLSEIKNIFKKFGGNLGENGSVSFLFERVGEIEVMEELDEERQLKLIDSGAVDFEDKIIVVKPEDVDLIRKRVEEMALKVIRAEITMRAKMPKRLKNEEGEKLESLLESLEESEDVLRVFKGAI